MTISAPQAVVVPVYNSHDLPYLDTLVARSGLFTTMIWGWQQQATRMVGPYRLHAKGGLVPFLFSPTEQGRKAVTHTAVSGLMVHGDPAPPRALAAWLSAHRIERFAVNKSKPGTGVGTFYVVTAATELPQPIPYECLDLASGRGALSPEKRRGYSLVRLPPALNDWYRDAQGAWRARVEYLPV